MIKVPLPEKVNAKIRCECAHCKNDLVLLNTINDLIDYLKAKEENNEKTGNN